MGVAPKSSRLPWSWGAIPEDLEIAYPCAGLVSGPTKQLYRAVEIAASPAVVFRWVCQIKVAPYSYDLIDNLGRRSPRTLTPGAEQLAIGQRFMVFRIVAFETDVHITAEVLPGPRRLLGPMACTYQVRPTKAGTRLVVRIDTPKPTGLRGLAAAPLAWGDLLMMRKQLLTIKELAKRI